MGFRVRVYKDLGLRGGALRPLTVGVGVWRISSCWRQ